MIKFGAQILFLISVLVSQVNAGNEYAEELCVNQYLQRQYDVAFVVCNKSAKEKPSYMNMLNIGNMYLNGWGIDKNVVLAIKYFEKAMSHEGGDGTAEHNLGYAYSEGIGVKKDISLAFALFRKAALSGHEDSQLNLAISYFNGEGVPVSHSDGYAWMLISSKYGNNTAAEQIVNINSWIAKEERFLGEKKANEILRSLPKSRKERLREKKADLIDLINRSE